MGDAESVARLVTELSQLVSDTVRRTRNLTPRAWREVLPQAGGPRSEAALRLAGDWAERAQLVEAEGAPTEPLRRPSAPAHEYALADVLAVTGTDLVRAFSAADPDTAARLLPDAMRETYTGRWHLLGAAPPDAG